jgi:hypothetical protein
MKIYNVATSYFMTQPKLSPKKARWKDFLAEFDMNIKYRSSRLNVVADALSIKTLLIVL